ERWVSVFDAGTVATAVSSLDGDTQKIAMGLGAVIILAGIWIFRERIKKWSAGIR
ncbi:MAG: hypothetical protein JKY94_07515, partial [Rhodobacteraceae bacterium]|nr:hypothetical protein [Paracoccaceae bacterium]